MKQSVAARGEARGRVLVVDDEAPQRAILAVILRGAGWEVAEAGSGAAALRALDPPPDVILTDLKMAGMDGLDLLAELRRSAPQIPVILMTAHGTVETAVRAMKEGAFDYLTKPLGRDELLIVVARALERVELERQNASLRAALDERSSFANIVAEHGSMRDVLRLVQKVAPSTSTVLVYGETGTGKELVARAVHAASPRRDGPFVAVNCAAIPPTLLESELFGHEKGAFTGAVGRRVGWVEQAAGGTLFLDEIGDLPLELQPKLLRVLQERQIARVGGTGTLPVDVRVVAATHRDLAAAIAEGRFREDLYWRLNVFPIVLPPLRARRTDIPSLVHRFLERVAAADQVSPKRISPAALDALVDYRWPGNVRQLQSIVERACLLADGPEIGLEDLPAEVRSPSGEVVLNPSAKFVLPDEGFVFEEFERDLLAQALARSGGVIARAAKMLGMTYRTLQYRLEKFGLRPKAEPGSEDPEA